jgi:hypothetical protein
VPLRMETAGKTTNCFLFTFLYINRNRIIDAIAGWENRNGKLRTRENDTMRSNTRKDQEFLKKYFLMINCKYRSCYYTKIVDIAPCRQPSGRHGPVGSSGADRPTLRGRGSRRPPSRLVSWDVLTCARTARVSACRLA